MPNFVCAQDTASLPVKVGVTPTTVSVKRGTWWYEDDPVVLAHPRVFSSTPADISRTSGWTPKQGDEVVEQATAAPGEKRASGRQAKNAADAG